LFKQFPETQVLIRQNLALQTVNPTPNVAKGYDLTCGGETLKARNLLSLRFTGYVCGHTAN
jgi:hypothetical protein